jgi:hypothetical protein
MNPHNLVIDEHFLLSIKYKTHKMDKLDSHSDTIVKDNTEYFVHLIRIALADDVITTKELELLHRVSKRLGFTVEETDHLIRTTGKSDYTPPSGLRARFDQIYEIVNMTLVDGTINKNEMYLASSFAAKSGFNEKEIPSMLVLLLNGIRQGKNKDELFKEFQDKVLKHA